MKSVQIVSIALLCALLLFPACGEKDIPQVVVERGAYNQPAITVRSAPDNNADVLLIEKQGYVEAQDRWLQMDMLRRVSQGRLAEIFGPSAVERDTQMIAAGLPYAAQRSLEKLRARYPEAVVLLEAFARGANQWVQEQTSLNTDLLRTYRRWTNNPSYTIDRWEVIDSVSVAESISFFLSTNISQRILIGKIAAAYLGDTDKASQLLDLRSIEPTYITEANQSHAVPRSASLPRSAKKALGALQKLTVGGSCVPRSYPFPPCFQEPSYGSNNWTVSKEFTGGKQGFVANDPHLQLSFPNNFIELALDSTPAGGTLKVRGLNLPGVPGVLMGHNDRIAWAITNNPADVDDVYIEVMNADQTVVEFEKRTVALETIAHVLRVRQLNGALEERTVALRWVPHHGPMLSDHFPEVKPALVKLEELLGKKAAITYKWTGHAGSTEIAAVLGVNRAKNYGEFKTALQAFEVGAQNFVYGDVDGNIGYYSHANFPVRKYMDRLLPGVPVFGWLGGEFEWQPEWRANVPEVDPSVGNRVGRIVTANNDPLGTTFEKDFYKKDYFGMGFDMGARAKRITELLDEKKGNLTLADMQRIQCDHKDLFALRVNGLLGKVSSRLRLNPKAAAVYNELLSYDGLALRERRGPVVFDTFIKTFAKQYFKSLEEALKGETDGLTEEEKTAKAKDATDTIDQLVNSMLGVKTVYHKINELVLVETPTDETLKLIEASLDQTAAELVNKDDRWGQSNKLNFFNTLVGIFPSMVSAPVERNGSFATVDVASKIHGPNFRLIMVLEEGKPIEGVNVLAGGNYSPLHGNQWMNELMLWRDGKYRDLVPFAK